MKAVFPIFRAGSSGYVYTVEIAAEIVGKSYRATVLRDVPSMRISSRYGEMEWIPTRATEFRAGERIFLTEPEHLFARTEVNELLSFWEQSKAQLSA